MAFQFFQRRTIWWPTPLGWFLLSLLWMVPATLWIIFGERFLSYPERRPAEVLVVEGWIGEEGIREAKAEFLRGGYRFIVATGGLSGENWSPRRWSYAAEAEEQLLRMKIPREQVILARPQETETDRTFGSALAVRAALRARGLQSASVNIYTRGAHARRSRLIYAKVLETSAPVGVVTWLPSGYENQFWWRSSARAEALIKETVAYPLELLLNSGRTSNSTGMTDTP
ncbi:MAG TPA: ElyC/SanA/YdcF family protein [Lacunisphaera sp.]|nr:ElyC/SanA/YdcF family protein [Lacunisphaera sp.]